MRSQPVFVPLRRLSLVLLSLGTFGLLLSACGGLFGGPPTGNYGGKVSGSDAFIAVVARDGHALAYVCDGQTMAEWFSGTLSSDGTLEVTNKDGAHLHATLTSEHATGTFTPTGGQPLSFTAPPASGDAGLYRGTGTLHGERLVAGWIILSASQQRGAIREGEKVVAGPALTTSQPTLTTQDGATLSVQHLDHFVEKTAGG
jgi:hypothetical protein